jgi:RNA polymerase sigma-70 factor (ECF subfamily)
MGADTRLEQLGVSGLGKIDEPVFSGAGRRRCTEATFHDHQLPRLGLPQRLPAADTE